MKQRSITGLIMAVVFIPLLLIPQLFIPFYILMGICVTIASLELIKMFGKEKEVSKETKVITVFLTILMYIATAWFTKNVDNLTIISNISRRFMFMSFFVTIFSLTLLILENNFDAKDIGKILTTVFYVGLGGASIVLLRTLGLRFIIYLFLTTIATDIFAYLFGIKFGKHKMAPTISPKKSWEGAIAGTIMATLLAGTFGLLFGVMFKGGIINPNGYKTLIDGLGGLGKINLAVQGIIIYVFTIVLSVVGQIGDLIASKMKRTYEIKDFGNIFPGHGGVLDRFDSAFFASMFLIAAIIFLLPSIG